MSDVLTLASEFIERMANPAYGIRINEDYSLRFGALLVSDEFEPLLRREVGHLRHADTLSPHGWIWLLDWAKSKNVVVNDKLLLELTEQWSSTFMQVCAIELATRNAEWTHRAEVSTVEDFPNQWLSKLMQRSTTLPSEELGVADSPSREEPSSEYVSTSRAESVLTALLQVGRDITIDAAATLLRHRWAGHTRLVQFFWSRCDGLDNETQQVWRTRLRPPERSDGSGHFEAE